MEKKYLEAGKANNTHGLQGELKFEHWCESDKACKDLKNLYLDEKGEKKFAVSYIRGSGGRMILKLEGIDTVEEAQKIKGRILFAERKELDPENKKVFVAEIIGENMTDDKTGEVLGEIIGTDPRGSGGLYIVKLKNGKEVFFPIVKDFIVSYDRESGVRVNPPEGIFE